MLRKDFPNCIQWPTIRHSYAFIHTKKFGWLLFFFFYKCKKKKKKSKWSRRGESAFVQETAPWFFSRAGLNMRGTTKRMIDSSKRGAFSGIHNVRGPCRNNTNRAWIALNGPDLCHAIFPHVFFFFFFYLHLMKFYVQITTISSWNVVARSEVHWPLVGSVTRDRPV